MDKLKPFIDNKFWIFLFLALLLPFIGWYIATGTFAEGVATREGAIEADFNSLNFSAEIPNESWVDGAEELVKEEQKRLDQAQQQLWLSQKETMDWPANVQPLIGDTPYEGKLDPRALQAYRSGYYRQLSKIEEILRPFDELKGEGVVLYDRSVLTNHVPDGTWRINPPLDLEMWNAQIDTWLVRSLFESIAAMNNGADKITDAPIRQILELTLRGGVRDYSEGGGDAGGGAGASSGGADDMMMMSYNGAAGDMGGGSGGGGSGVQGGSVPFDLSDELGPDSKGGAGAGAGMMASDAMMPGGSGGAGETPDAPAGPKRYVDDGEDLPFRSRAFVLGVIMDHRELNRFLAELSRSKWPVQILRVHQEIINPDELSSSGKRMTPGRRGGAGMPSQGTFGGGTGFGATPGMSDMNYTDDATGGGTGFGAGTGGSRGGMGRGAGASHPLAQQALTDPYLARVWIGGLITLFKPIDYVEPEPEVVPPSADPTVADPVAGDATVPADDTAAADSAAETTTDNADPSAPATPAEGDATETPATTPEPGTDDTSSEADSTTTETAPEPEAPAETTTESEPAKSDTTE